VLARRECVDDLPAPRPLARVLGPDRPLRVALAMRVLAVHDAHAGRPRELQQRRDRRDRRLGVGDAQRPSLGHEIVLHVDDDQRRPLRVHPDLVKHLVRGCDRAHQRDRTRGGKAQSARNRPVGPSPVPLNHAVRAAYLWVADPNGAYTFSGAASNPPLCWITVSAQPQLAETANVGLNLVVNSVAGSTAVCSMANRYVSGVPILVTVDVNPTTNTLAYAVEEHVPIGWQVTDLNNNGVFFGSAGVIKWGVFFDGISRVFSYRITPPAGASGIVAFNGVASFGGNSISITGSRFLLPPPATAAVLFPLEFPNQFETRIRGSGDVGGTYILERSSNLGDWAAIQTNVNTAGTISFIDRRTNSGNAFYRAVSP